MRLLCSVALAMLVTCDATELFSQEFSFGLLSRYRVSPNLAYVRRDGWEGKVDVYSRRDDPGPHPTLIWFHGGNATRGSKDEITISLLPYLELGWDVVNVEHRLPGVTLAPAAVQNALCAVRWVASHASEQGFDTKKLVLAGNSSGGWSALAAAIVPRAKGWDEFCPGTEEPAVAAVVNWFGFSDLNDALEPPNEKAWASTWIAGLANPAQVAKNVSPLNFIRASVPAVISIHGDADPEVPYSQSVRLHEALKRVGVSEELITIRGGRHGGFGRMETQRAFTAVGTFLARQGIRPLPTKN